MCERVTMNCPRRTKMVRSTLLHTWLQTSLHSVLRNHAVPNVWPCNRQVSARNCSVHPSHSHAQLTHRTLLPHFGTAIIYFYDYDFNKIQEEFSNQIFLPKQLTGIVDVDVWVYMSTHTYIGIMFWISCYHLLFNFELPRDGSSAALKATVHSGTAVPSQWL